MDLVNELYGDVAPVRERGLKLTNKPAGPAQPGRSREGAWIEMPAARRTPMKAAGRSREGAWIEIPGILKGPTLKSVAPVRERGLKSAVNYVFLKDNTVAPVRERGLKCRFFRRNRRYSLVAPVRERGLKSR